MNPDNTNPNTGVPAGPTPSPTPEPTPAPQPAPATSRPTSIPVSGPTPATPPVTPPQPIQPSPAPPAPAAPTIPPTPIESPTITPSPTPDVEPSLEDLSASVSQELSQLTPEDLNPVQPDTTPTTPTPTTAGPELTPPTPGPDLPPVEKLNSQPLPEESTPVTPQEDIQPAAPVPGSIGSAISVPPTEGTGDSTELPEEPVVMEPSPFTQSSQPKRLRRLTSALLFIVIILGLGVGGYYGWQYLQDQKSAVKTPAPETQSVTPTPAEPSTTTISCQRDLTDEELTDFVNAKSGTIDILVKYKDDDFDHIIKTTTILYPDEATANLGLTPVKNQDNQYITTAGIKESVIKSQYTVDQAKLVGIITSLQGFVLDHKTAIAFNFAIPPAPNTNKNANSQTSEATTDQGSTSNTQTVESNDGSVSESSVDQALTSDDIKSAIESSGFICDTESTTPLP